MHSLSLKFRTDLNSVVAARCLQGRGKFGVSDFASVWFRDFGGKGCRIVACASNGNGGGKSSSSSSSSSPSTKPSSFLSRSQNYALLKQKMEVAAKSEVCWFFLSDIFFCFLCNQSEGNRFELLFEL